MDLVTRIKQTASQAIEELFGFSIPDSDISVNETKEEFPGDYTVVLFSFVKQFKKNPQELGAALGGRMQSLAPDLIAEHHVVKGFLNLSVNDRFWDEFLAREAFTESFGFKPKTGRRVMVEYSSPNTNKPLHLGHLRNNFLGWSVAAIFQANGYDVVKTCIANDRGIHICKSMLAWKLFANGATPSSSGVKGDHFVGDYYVRFTLELKKQRQVLIQTGLSEEEAEREAPIMKMAQQMLVDWEAGDPQVLALWNKMNSWVYEGFDQTYKRIGSDFDKIYYESQTYLPGKDLVDYGIKKKVFEQKQDGSVWIDLTADGLDQKIVQRRDGTAVYITQDIGLVVSKYEDFHCPTSIYVVGDEQNYHFKVLQLIAQKLQLPSADGLFHLSYGMVELPSGRMKTREGTVVDADDILDEMVKEAERKTKEQGKTEGFSDTELQTLYEQIGVGGIKFFLLRVDPKKRILFNPEDSIDLHGYTATCIQYAHARIRSILRKQEEQPESEMNSIQKSLAAGPLLPAEKSVIKLLERYPGILDQACTELNPSVIASYAYELTKSFNSFYSVLSIMNAESAEKKALRLKLAHLTSIVLRSSMGLLGIQVPERM